MRDPFIPQDTRLNLYQQWIWAADGHDLKFNDTLNSLAVEIVYTKFL